MQQVIFSPELYKALTKEEFKQFYEDFPEHIIFIYDLLKNKTLGYINKEGELATI